MADATTLSHSDIVLLVVCWSQQRKGGYGCEPFVFVEWRQGSHVAVLLSDRLLCRTREGSAKAVGAGESNEFANSGCIGCRSNSEVMSTCVVIDTQESSKMISICSTH